MIISAVITSYFVLGFKVNEESLEYSSFVFDLPFPFFRDLDAKYWEEVKQKIQQVSKADKDTKIYVTTQDEFLLKTQIFDGLTRISDILSNSNFPVVYLGETKGSVRGIVSPFVINPSDFFKWFYLAENINQVENYFYNRQAYGVKKPVGNWEEGFEEALFREKISFIFENSAQPFFSNTSDLILTGEGTLYAGDLRRVTLSFLDGCKTEGFWRIYLDRDLFILNIQNLGFYNLELSKKLFEKLQVEDLAGCLVIPGAKEVEIKIVNGESLKVNLEDDSISVIPFDKEHTVDVKVKFEKKTKFIKASGGDLGLVLDNRNRPLLSDKNAKQRIALIDKWLAEISSKFEFNSKFEKEKKEEGKKQKEIEGNTKSPVQDNGGIALKEIDSLENELSSTKKNIPTDLHPVVMEEGQEKKEEGKRRKDEGIKSDNTGGKIAEDTTDIPELNVSVNANSRVSKKNKKPEPRKEVVL